MLLAMFPGVSGVEFLDGLEWDACPLDDLNDEVEKLMEGYQEPEYVAFVKNDDSGNETYNNFCPDCGEKIVIWVRGQGEFPANETIKGPEDIDSADLEEWREEVLAGEIKPDDIRLMRYRESMEADGPEACIICGHRLFVSPLRTFVESEVEHFEEVLKLTQAGKSPFDFTPDTWFDIHEMIRGIDFVERDYWPNEFDKADEVARYIKLYRRVLDTVKGFVSLAQTAAAKEG